MSDVRLQHDFWWFTTPHELREIAAQMESFWQTCQPGQSKIVTKRYGKNEVLTILVDQTKIESPGWQLARCDHRWDGPRIELNSHATVATCSRCGQVPESLRSAVPQRAGTPDQRETLERSGPSVTGTKSEDPAN